MTPEIRILRGPSGEEETKTGYFMNKDDLVRLIQDFRYDILRGFTGTDSSYVEGWLSQRQVSQPAPERRGYWIEGSHDEVQGEPAKGIRLDPEGGMPVPPAYEKDPADYAMGTKVILGFYVVGIITAAVYAIIEKIRGL